MFPAKNPTEFLHSTARSEYFGARWGLVLGASVCLVAAAFGALVLRRIARPDDEGNRRPPAQTHPAQAPTGTFAVR